jgi:hypothetical protein
MFTTSVDSLRPYCGYYHYYYYTPSRPGHDPPVASAHQRLQGHPLHLPVRAHPAAESPLGRSHFVRYVGVAVMLGGRIFIVDHNARALRSMSQTILFPSPPTSRSS